MSGGNTRVGTSIAVEYQSTKRLDSSLDFVEQSQSRRRDTAASHVSRRVCAGDARMLECRRCSARDGRALQGFTTLLGRLIGVR
jgi:hypothetical protein